MLKSYRWLSRVWFQVELSGTKKKIAKQWTRKLRGKLYGIIKGVIRIKRFFFPFQRGGSRLAPDKTANINNASKTKLKDESLTTDELLFPRGVIFFFVFQSARNYCTENPASVCRGENVICKCKIIDPLRCPRISSCDSPRAGQSAVGRSCVTEGNVRRMIAAKSGIECVSELQFWTRSTFDKDCEKEGYTFGISA